MQISDFCNPSVVYAPSDTTILEASRLMRQQHVGDLVITINRDGLQIPLGIVTDRDIIMEVVAMGLDTRVITVGDIMNRNLVTVEAAENVADAIRLMSSKGVRRLPVIGDRGELIGIITVDDLLNDLGSQLTELGKVVSRQRTKETWERRATAG